MVKKSVVKRVYSKEFKDEAVALVGKGEKSARQIASDLGISDNVLYRWISRQRQSVRTGERAFPGHGRPRDEELSRLRKENKALREANEILKKAAVIFAQADPQK